MRMTVPFSLDLVEDMVGRLREPIPQTAKTKAIWPGDSIAWASGVRYSVDK